MTKYYADSEEKYLKSVVLYGIQATGGVTTGLFYDAEGTQQAYDDDYDWEELFLKGLIRVNLDAYNMITNPMAFIKGDERFKAPRLTVFDRALAVVTANFFEKDSNDSGLA